MGRKKWMKKDYLTVGDDITYIMDGAFSNRRLLGVEIPSNVTKIGDFAFIGNELFKVKLSNGLLSIGKNAFSYNNITNIEIPSSVNKIGDFAFSNNKITNLVLNEGIVEIGNYSFYSNCLTSVKIPSSVKKIGKNTFFNTDIIYDGVKLSKDLINKYGSENIIKLVNISKFSSIFSIKSFPVEVIKQIPLEEESVKDYERNYKVYNEIKENLLSKNILIDEEILFKLCYILGLFKRKSGAKELVYQILDKYSASDITSSLSKVKITNYKDGANKLILKLFMNDSLEYNNEIIIGKIYQYYENIKKFTVKRHEIMISDVSAKIKRLEENNLNSSMLKENLKLLKENIKNISYNDLICFFKNNNLVLRKGNEKLRQIIDELSLYVDQDGLDIIQDIYEESKKVIKSIPMTEDKNKSGITYYWAKSDDLINITIGYLLKICSKLGDVGEDIMRQSLINKDIANLIIYDENKKIIGKATAYYNKDKKYILFNNAVLKNLDTKDLKTKNKIETDSLKAILRATSDVMDELKKKGVNISDVRVGMTKNSLSNSINDMNLNIELDDLLPNYNFNGYYGDANNFEGQAVLYSDKDDLELVKTKKISS